MIGVIALAGILLFTGLSRGPALETGSWGLSFPQPGQSPTGNASPEALAAYDAAFLGDPQEKTIYLTIDAGYENGSTAKILDALAKHNVKAAFFLVGNYIERNPDLTRRMVEEIHKKTRVFKETKDESLIDEIEQISNDIMEL